jgi:hypothetical protein
VSQFRQNATTTHLDATRPNQAGTARLSVKGSGLKREPPDVGALLNLLNEHDVRYLGGSSVSASETPHEVDHCGEQHDNYECGGSDADEVRVKGPRVHARCRHRGSLRLPGGMRGSTKTATRAFSTRARVARAPLPTPDQPH